MSQNATQTDAATSAREIRKKRAKTLVLRFGVFVGGPTLVAMLYFGAIASDVYQSTAKFTVQTSENRPVVGLEALVGGVTGSVSTRDALAVQEFILSRDMLARLFEDHQWREHYTSSEGDWWSRLSSSATFEKAFQYYLEQVTIKYDTLSGLLTMDVRAYSAEMAKEQSDSILKYSEKMVNQLSERARQDQIQYAKHEVAQAEQRVTAANEVLLKLQAVDAEFHPAKSAQTLMSVRGELEVALAKTQAALNQAKAVMRPDAPKVVALRQKSNALTKQIEREKKRLVGSDTDGLNLSLVAFESAMMEKEFAQKGYQSAMATFEMAKMEAARQSRYLATIAPPSLPDEATHPQRLLGALTGFLMALSIFGIVSLLVAAIREHARI